MEQRFKKCGAVERYLWYQGALLCLSDLRELENQNLLNRLHGEPGMTLDVLVFSAYKPNDF